MKSLPAILLGAIGAVTFSCSEPQLNERNIDKIISRMTLEEKVRMLVGTCTDPANPPYPAPGTMTDRPDRQGDFENTYRAANRVQGSAGESYGIDRLGIPSLVYADGPAGLRIDPCRESCPEMDFHCTAFPSATLLASTWDIQAAEETGSAIGNEVREFGVDIILAPGMNIKRNPLTGRNFEYYSEDPMLSGKMAGAVVRGIQSQGVGACIKHYAVNNQETYRNGINVIIREDALREIYLRGFETAVKESSPWTIMSSYNKVNGEYASESRRLLRDILRDEWGYKGFVMTDWWGADSPVAQMQAGNNLLMPGTPYQIEELTNAVREGRLDEKVLDRNLKAVLETVTKSPSFRKYPYSHSPDRDKHAALARKVAAEGMVLLENKEMLPLEKPVRAALFGNNSYDTQIGGSGSGYVHRKYKVNIAEGLEDAGFILDSTLKEIYLTHIEEEKSHMPAENFWSIPIAPEAEIRQKHIAAAAENNDIAVLTIGRMSGEGSDRHSGKGDYLLTDHEMQLLQNISSAFKAKGKKTLVILNMGDAIEFTGWNDIPDALLMAWLPGQEAGNAVADIITGKVAPSGRLPMTMASDYMDIPSSANFGVSPGETNRVIYEEGLMVGYRYFCTAGVNTSYPFGYGLSYAEFEYSGFRISGDRKQLTAEVTVRNSSDRAGREVVQLYVRKPGGKERPAMELCGFHKTEVLAPGESEAVRIRMKTEDLKMWNNEKSCWTAPSNGYVFHIGTSAEDIRASVEH